MSGVGVRERCCEGGVTLWRQARGDASVRVQRFLEILNNFAKYLIVVMVLEVPRSS